MADKKRTQDRPELVDPNEEGEEKPVETEAELEQPLATAIPHEQPETEKRTYFFPPDFSCQAESLEEATKLYDQHTKGAH